MEGLTGATAIETKATGFMISVAVALMPPKAAVIVLEPPLDPLANPAALIAAPAG
jgi:hypothetical protein